MAATQLTLADEFENWFPPADHPILYNRFSAREREELFSADLLAGRTVPLLLASLILLGTIAGMATVLALW